MNKNLDCRSQTIKIKPLFRILSEKNLKSRFSYDLMCIIHIRHGQSHCVDAFLGTLINSPPLIPRLATQYMHAYTYILFANVYV